MLLTLMILQGIITLVLNQSHQQLMAQFERPTHDLPILVQAQIRGCLNGHCGDNVCHFQVQSLAQTPERQFFNADLTLCENGDSYQIQQVFSQGSAILNGEREFHAVTVGKPENRGNP